MIARVHEHSFAAKLASLAVGEEMFLRDDAPLTGPTRLERAVHTAMLRSPKVRGRRFVTARADIIVARHHYLALRIERVE